MRYRANRGPNVPFRKNGKDQKQSVWVWRATSVLPPRTAVPSATYWRYPQLGIQFQNREVEDDGKSDPGHKR